MWTKKHLSEVIREKMADYQLVVASNRQPYSHFFRDGKVFLQRQPGGLITALDPVMKSAHGTWVAAGSKSDDRRVLNEKSKVTIAENGHSYTLKRIFLSKEEADSYYYGYSNEGLWPLCHTAFNRPLFLASDWKVYERVNRRFAEAIMEEIGDQKAFVWVQDYHLVLVAKFLKEMGNPNIITALFWHIPWPSAEIFQICPQKNEILEGMLAYDLLGFHTRNHCDNFAGAVDRELESRIDRENQSVIYKNHETLIRPFPVSVDFESISNYVTSADSQIHVEKFRQEISAENQKIILGVDRIDYTKGIPERFRAIDRFLEKYPEQKEKFVFYQIGQISRLHIPRYKQLNDELNALVEDINWKHSQGSWSPIVFKRTQVSYQEILSLYYLADVCVVSSLHDGLNLVAKEYVSAKPDLKGVLILSKFTGAARELTDALLINPYDTETFADALFQAVEMSAEEQEKRMKKMRDAVAFHNIYRWAGKILSQLLKFEFQEV